MRIHFLSLLACTLTFVLPSASQADDVADLARLTALRQQYPHDVDHALARAQLLARLGDDEAALDDLREAVTLAPDYEDVWRVPYTILSRQENDAAQHERRQLLDEAAQRFPDSSWWRITAPAASPRRS